MTTELYRRAAISFPDEDVLVAGRFARPGIYELFGALQDPVPRPGYRPSGEDRAWGRRLAKRFGCEDRYDDRAFCASGTGQPEPLLDADLGDPEPAVTELLAPVDPARGDSIIAFGWVRGDVHSLQKGISPLDPSCFSSPTDTPSNCAAAACSNRFYG